MSGVLRMATEYSETRDHVVIGEISSDTADEEIAAGAVEGIFGSDTRIGAAQNACEGVLASRQRFSLMVEVVALRHAFDVAGIAFLQEVERLVRRNDVLGLGRRLGFLGRDGDARRLAQQSA